MMSWRGGPLCCKNFFPREDVIMSTPKDKPGMTPLKSTSGNLLVHWISLQSMGERLPTRRVVTRKWLHCGGLIQHAWWLPHSSRDGTSSSNFSQPIHLNTSQNTSMCNWGKIAYKCLGGVTRCPSESPLTLVLLWGMSTVPWSNHDGLLQSRHGWVDR